MDWTTALGFVLVGFTGGAFGSLVGLGGATFVIPLATLLLDPDTQQLRAAAMVSNTFVAAGAIGPYARAKQINWRTFWAIAPWTILWVVVGVWLSMGIDAVLYRGMFGIFVLLVVARELHTLLRAPSQQAAPRQLRPLPAGLAGTLAGLAGGVLSVGGGVVFVPFQREWLRTPVKEAAATSMALVLPSVAVGAVVQMWSMAHLPAPGGGTLLPGAAAIAACFAPAALAGGWVGATLNTRIPRRAVQWTVVCALALAGLMLVRPWVARVMQAPGPAPTLPAQPTP
ncbi:MAG: sulfite exporter TauE/SafE family protein [Phycisphaerales bacterium]